MILLKYRKFKTIKLKDLVPRGKNLYRFNIFFNIKKYRRKKWEIQRGKTLNYRFYNPIVFKRIDANQKYLFFQRKNALNVSVNMLNIHKSLTYKLKLMFKRRLQIFFYSLREKFIKKFIVFRHYLHRFNSFDNNLTMLLLRMGIILTFKEARKFIKLFGLTLGKSTFRIVIRKTNIPEIFTFLEYKRFLVYYFPNDTPNRPFNMAKEEQLFQPSRWLKPLFIYKTTNYNYKDDEYITRKVKLRLNLFQRALLLTLRPTMENRVFQKITNQFNLPTITPNVNMYRNVNAFISGILPMPFPVNYANMSFYFLNLKIRNQWSHYIDFYMLKKFLQYRR